MPEAGGEEAEMFELSGRTALVTGASGGIGGAIARALDAQGAAVALSGRVPVKVDTQYGAIEIGDLLAPSPTPGVAMKATQPGPTIGTAMEAFSGGAGKVLAFVHRGQYTPMEGIEAIQDELEAALDERTPDPISGVQSLPGHMQVVLDKDANDESRFSVFRNGEDGLEDEVFRVDERGNVYAKGSFRPNSMDVAEFFTLSEPAEAGDVLVADRESPGRYRLARSAGDPAKAQHVNGCRIRATEYLEGRSIPELC